MNSTRLSWSVVFVVLLGCDSLVAPDQREKSLWIMWDNIELEVGDVVQMKALLRPSPSSLLDTLRNGDWKASESQVLDVNAAGRAEALSPGTTDVYFERDGLFDTVRVRVVDPGHSPSMKWERVSVGAHTVCALDTDGRAYCWGSDFFGNLGNGHHDRWTRTVAPEPVLTPLSWQNVEVGVDHACGLSSAGGVYCWGSTVALREPATSASSDILTPERWDLPGSVIELSVGGRHNCALTTEDGAYCWGFNSGGQIGDGTAGMNEFRRVPARVQTTHEFAALSLGLQHSCALTQDGEAWCWGYGGAGDLGTGTRTDASVPVRVATDVRFATMSQGHCGMARTGEGVCWGENTLHQLLLEDEWVLTPTAIDPGFEVAGLYAGGPATCATSFDGPTYCWGADRDGLLGSGAVADEVCQAGAMPCSADPLAVAGDHRFRQVSIGWWTTCGVTDEDELYCWGANDLGQLGNGSTVDGSTVPVRVTDPFAGR